jgi:hypothetical protein
MNTQALYRVTEGPHGTWIRDRDGHAIGRDMQLGFAIQQALLLSQRESIGAARGARVQLVSGGNSYDLTH